MRIAEAIALQATLSEQARETGLKGADGDVLGFKVVVTGKGVHGFSVQIIEMVQRTNFMSRKLFWEDKDANYTTSPRSETYWSS